VIERYLWIQHSCNSCKSLLGCQKTKQRFTDTCEMMDELTSFFLCFWEAHLFGSNTLWIQLRTTFLLQITTYYTTTPPPPHASTPVPTPTTPATPPPSAATPTPAPSTLPERERIIRQEDTQTRFAYWKDPVWRRGECRRSPVHCRAVALPEEACRRTWQRERRCSGRRGGDARGWRGWTGWEARWS